eukprot:s3155_g8.t1
MYQGAMHLGLVNGTGLCIEWASTTSPLARLAADQAPLPLSFFQDGVKLGRCNFQPFGSRAAQQLLQAMLLSAEEQRYFPYELKEEYPDGVMLKVVDRVAVTFAVWQKEYASADPDLDPRADRLAMGGRVLNAPTVTSSEKVLRAGQICEARLCKLLFEPVQLEV